MTSYKHNPWEGRKVGRKEHAARADAPADRPAYDFQKVRAEAHQRYIDEYEEPEPDVCEWCANAADRGIKHDVAVCVCKCHTQFTPAPTSPERRSEVLADGDELLNIISAQQAQVAELTEANGRYRKALEHYADASNWDSGATQNGVRWDEALYSPLKGESERGYDIARQALHPKQEEQDGATANS